MLRFGDVDAWGGEPDADEFVGVWIGKRFEEDAFENAEDDGVAANTGGESDKRDDGEERGAAETAEDLLQVEQECFHLRCLRGTPRRRQGDGRRSLMRETKVAQEMFREIMSGRRVVQFACGGSLGAPLEGRTC